MQILKLINIFLIKKKPLKRLKKQLLIRTLFLVIFVIFPQNARQYESLFSRLHLWGRMFGLFMCTSKVAVTFSCEIFFFRKKYVQLIAYKAFKCIKKNLSCELGVKKVMYRLHKGSIFSGNFVNWSQTVKIDFQQLYIIFHFKCIHSVLCTVHLKPHDTFHRSQVNIKKKFM